MLLCTLNTACGEAIEVIQHHLEAHKLSAEVGFSAGHNLITRVWQMDKDEASLGLEMALLNHHTRALKNGANVTAGCALGLNPYGADVYAVVLGDAPADIRTALAKQLVHTAIKKAIDRQAN